MEKLITKRHSIYICSYYVYKEMCITNIIKSFCQSKEILSLILGNYYKYLYSYLLKFIVKERKSFRFMAMKNSVTFKRKGRRSVNV